MLTFFEKLHDDIMEFFELLSWTLQEISVFEVICEIFEVKNIGIGKCHKKDKNC